MQISTVNKNINYKTFSEVIENYNWNEIEEKINAVTASEVATVLRYDRLTEKDFLVLLSPVAENFLEDFAQISRAKTQKRFGKNNPPTPTQFSLIGRHRQKLNQICSVFVIGCKSIFRGFGGQPFRFQFYRACRSKYKLCLYLFLHLLFA